MVAVVLRLRVAALCIVYPIHDSRPAGPFGKAAVREVDGEKAEPDLSNENDQRNYLKSPKVKKGPNIEVFAGRFRTGRTCPNSSEFQAHCPTADRAPRKNLWLGMPELLAPSRP
jgi:hypothetical protein